MILKTVKKEFSNGLVDFYPESEISSFFNLLAEDILKLKRVDVALNLYAVVSGKKYDKFKIALDSLKLSEPIQYIIGSTEFYGLPFKVNEHTLIPRPETEELVALIIENSKKGNPESKPIKILDIGTGSGCIAIALAKELPNAKVYALDISEEAIKMAKQNAKLNEVDIEFIQTDILDNNLSDKELQGLTFDIIVSNPPYVREQEKAKMHKNVLDFEPDSALFVDDANALVFYDEITKLATEKLEASGQLFFEINEYLGKETQELVNSLGFKDVVIKKDLFGKDRMLKAENL
jgi:release factor glutamine methyltransferase